MGVAVASGRKEIWLGCSVAHTSGWEPGFSAHSAVTGVAPWPPYVRCPGPGPRAGLGVQTRRYGRDLRGARDRTSWGPEAGLIKDMGPYCCPHLSSKTQVKQGLGRSPPSEMPFSLLCSASFRRWCSTLSSKEADHSSYDLKENPLAPLKPSPGTGAGENSEQLRIKAHRSYLRSHKEETRDRKVVRGDRCPVLVQRQREKCVW